MSATPLPFPLKSKINTKKNKIMPQVNCPTLGNILASNECLENLAGVGSVVYVGVKGDLSAPLSATDNQYGLPTFKAGKGLYRLDCKEEAQKYAFSSLGRRKGYEITGTLVLEAVNKDTAKILRAMNNLDLFLILWTTMALRSLFMTPLVRWRPTQAVLPVTLATLPTATVRLPWSTSSRLLLIQCTMSPLPQRADGIASWLSHRAATNGLSHLKRILIFV